MAIEIVTDFRVLLKLASVLGQAEKNGDLAEIEKARIEHDAYKELCLKSSRMNLGVTNGSL